MNDNVLDLITAPLLAKYWKERRSDKSIFLGQTLFPSKKKPGHDLSWVRGCRRLEATLKPNILNAKTELRDRIGFKKIESEMPLFIEGIKIDEKDLQELLELQKSNPTYYSMIIDNIYDGIMQLINGGLIQAERMRMQLLQGGKIHIESDGLVYNYDFDESGEYEANNTLELSSTTMWSDYENSNPIPNIQYVKNYMYIEYGATISKAILTTATWLYLLQNKSIKMDIYGYESNRHNFILTDQVLQTYLFNKLGIEFIRYDKRFMDGDSTHPFFNDGNVAFIPNGDLGTTWFGTTLGEAELLGDIATMQGSVIETGIEVKTFVEKHSLNVNAIVSQVSLPSFERMFETFKMKVS